MRHRFCAWENVNTCNTNDESHHIKKENNTMKWKRINESQHNRYIVSYKVVKPFFNEVSVQADSEEDAVNRALIGLKRDYKRAGEEIEDIEIIDVKPNSDDAHTNGFGYDDIDV